MIFANIIAPLHAIADTIGKIVAEVTLDYDRLFFSSRHKIRCTDFYRRLKKKPRVLIKPILAIAPNMKITPLGITTWISISLVLLSANRKTTTPQSSSRSSCLRPRQRQ